MDDLITWLRAQLDAIEAASAHDLASIERHDFALERLAEVDAKRRILDLHPPIRRRLWLEVAEESGGGAVSLADLTCSRCFPSGVPVEVGVDPWAPCMTVRLLALPYADRDGYREEWRP